MNLGDKLKARRKELSLTLKEVAVSVGVAEATVQRWESGNIKMIKGDKLKKLASVLQISIDELSYWISGAEKPTKQNLQEWDEKANLDLIQSEMKIAELIEHQYGKEILKLFSEWLMIAEDERQEISKLLHQYSKLDDLDRAAIIGAIGKMIEKMLKDEKYSIQKESKNA